jgi:hypothetical protein
VKRKEQTKLNKWHPDPYVKAWLEWKERYEKEGKEKAERLEKQERLETGWNLVKLCGEIIRENYDGWQEREITEMEKKELLDLKLEKEARLERQKRKKDEFKEGRKVMSKEEMFLRKIELAEIKENAWKWRGSTSSHEEHARRQEKGKKTAEKEKTLEKVRKRMRKEEEEEMTRKKIFLERWKEKEERKRRQKTAEEGWKNLMNSISEWEEMILDDSSEEEAPEMELMTEEGFRVAGRIMEGILEEVIAFTELDEKLGGTSPNKKPKSACVCGLGLVEHAEPGGGDRQGGADDRLGQVEHAEPGGDDRQGGVGAGDRLVQVEPAEPGGGDRQGGTEAGDGLWQEVGCGRTSVEMLRDKMSCSGPFCWGNTPPR